MGSAVGALVTASLNMPTMGDASPSEIAPVESVSSLPSGVRRRIRAMTVIVASIAATTYDGTRMDAAKK